MKMNLMILLFVILLSGCEWFGADNSAKEDVPVVMAESLDNTGKNGSNSLATEKMILNLNPGDRFPMKKTVDSILTQKVGLESVTNQSWLEMLMTVVVDRVENGNTLLSVKYQRVRYKQNIGQQKVEYDSSRDTNNIPPEALPYSALVNNGFQFWLGPDNKILKLENFEQFLIRCTEKFPPSQRAQLLTHLSESSGDDELANFVDDSIGILPYDPETGIASVSEGDVWTRKRKFIHPTTMYLDSKCTLRKLNQRYAEIDISGNIAATNAQQKSVGESDLYIRVRDGKTLGRCTVDRVSGLPVNSRIERHIDMLVFTGDGQEIPQEKKIVTTIEAFPMDGDPKLKRNHQVETKKADEIQQTSATSEKTDVK